MLLKEFFDATLRDIKNKNQDDDINQDDELFSFIINHDKLHKDYGIPLCMKIKEMIYNPSFDKSKLQKEMMPMVEKGCKEYYEYKKLNEKLSKVFPKSLREQMCQKLFDYYYEDLKQHKNKLK